MGVYLYALSGGDPVKVSGRLTEAVPVHASPSGSMPAATFLTRLATVEASFYASSPWRDLVASGAKARLDAAAASSSFVVPQTGPVSVWFEGRKLAAARSVGEAAVRAATPVSWG